MAANIHWNMYNTTCLRVVTSRSHWRKKKQNRNQQKWKQEPATVKSNDRTECFICLFKRICCFIPHSDPFSKAFRFCFFFCICRRPCTRIYDIFFLPSSFPTVVTNAGFLLAAGGKIVWILSKNREKKRELLALFKPETNLKIRKRIQGLQTDWHKNCEQFNTISFWRKFVFACCFSTIDSYPLEKVTIQVHTVDVYTHTYTERQ